MTNWKPGVWRKGDQDIYGTWRYFKSTDRFVIVLDKTCEITGKTIQFEISNDELAFNGWRLVATGVADANAR